MFVLNINTDLTDESILHPIDIDTTSNHMCYITFHIFHTGRLISWSAAYVYELIWRSNNHTRHGRFNGTAGLETGRSKCTNI